LVAVNRVADATDFLVHLLEGLHGLGSKRSVTVRKHVVQSEMDQKQVRLMALPDVQRSLSAKVVGRHFTDFRLPLVPGGSKG
jgi:hypothetical protein